MNVFAIHTLPQKKPYKCVITIGLKPEGKSRTRPVYNLPEIPNPAVLLIRQGTFFLKVPEVLFELPAVFWSGKHHIHMGIRKTETITIRRSHDRSVPALWTLEQTAPSCSRIGDTSGFPCFQVREDILLGSRMCGIVTYHKHVQGRIFSQLSRPMPVVDAHPNIPYHS